MKKLMMLVIIAVLALGLVPMLGHADPVGDCDVVCVGLDNAPDCLEGAVFGNSGHLNSDGTFGGGGC